MIRSLEDFDEFCRSNQKFVSSHLSSLSSEELSFFRHCLDFDDNGFVSKIYFGDLAKAGLNDFQIAEVASLFGIDEKRFKRTYHAFGDAQGNCVRRLYWWCPYGLEPLVDRQ
ncbi:hypothetical protein NA8A_05383 [Nitratireductor indicus C115]|uniref:Uncharacterized protein n=1 Tax=Nitratireductor indicus C115 TaxID=1231190 RepID=K2N7I8_9HYPH|nr:hypothetical protein [Nitratireductor indicus]EKF43438.1 hypothetical protein NA8A_05383 [Nitratireductor indicus C115]SFQ07630.1 hypothetical protein SAMN05216176_101228 [Nitratireductor indicus]